MKPGDLVRHSEPVDRAEFDAVGVVVEIQEDWMKNWSKVKVMWTGLQVPVWEPIRCVKLFTSS